MATFLGSHDPLFKLICYQSTIKWLMCCYLLNDVYFSPYPGPWNANHIPYFKVLWLCISNVFIKSSF